MNLLSVRNCFQPRKGALWMKHPDLLIFQLTAPPAETADTFITIKFDFDNAESIILEARLFIEI